MWRSGLDGGSQLILQLSLLVLKNKISIIVIQVSTLCTTEGTRENFPLLAPCDVLYTEKTKENNPNCLQTDIMACRHYPIAYPRLVSVTGPCYNANNSTLVSQPIVSIIQKPSGRSPRPRKREEDLGAPRKLWSHPWHLQRQPLLAGL